MVAKVVSAMLKIGGEMHCGILLRGNCGSDGGVSNVEDGMRNALWDITKGKLWLRWWYQRR